MNDPFDKTKTSPFKTKDDSAFDAAHANSDTDVDRSSMHHTLGEGPLQAAAGNHTHDKRYLRDAVLTGRMIADTPTANGVWTDVPISVDEETRDIFDVASPLITFKESGLYEFDIDIGWASNVSGTRTAGLFLQGLGLIYQRTSQTVSTGGFTAFSPMHTRHRFNAGDSVKFQGFQDSGVALAMDKDSGLVLFTHFTIKKLAN